MGERLAGGNVAIALLANTARHRGGLYVLIEVFAPISGAHFNPAVSLVMALRGELADATLLRRATSPPSWSAPCSAPGWPMRCSTWHRAVLGQGANGARPVARRGGRDVRPAAGRSCARRRPRVASLVASYIGAAYWFTASTSFANPAVAFGRMFSDTFAGIAPASAPGFVVAELVGAGLAVLAVRALESSSSSP